MSPNILSWIEYLAKHGELQLVFQLVTKSRYKMNHVVSPLLDKPKVFLQTHWGRMQGSTDEDVFVALSKFLMSPNILSWIEYLAKHGELQR
jgi:hypothetical protein